MVSVAAAAAAAAVGRLQRRSMMTGRRAQRKYAAKGIADVYGGAATACE